jgi:hypothetical protein
MTLILSLLLLSLAEEQTVSNPCARVENSVAVYNEHEQVEGCRIEKIDVGSMHEKLGLKVGDLVRPPARMKMYQQLKSTKIKDSEKSGQAL